MAYVHSLFPQNNLFRKYSFEHIYDVVVLIVMIKMHVAVIKSEGLQWWNQYIAEVDKFNR